MLTNAKTKTQTRSVRYGSWPSLLLLIIILMVVFTYRGYLLYKYCAIYLDDDQALMWNGAAAMGHLCFPEPCYWGQAYGSMFEAVVAVPLYWLRIPMNIALPLATMIMSFFPYLFIALRLYKRKSVIAAFITVAFYLLMSWEWDILTSIPRSLISGFPLAVCGAIVLNEAKTGTKSLTGVLMIMTGMIMTNNAIVIGALAFVHYFFHFRRNKRFFIWNVAGLIIGLMLYISVKNFYRINVDYSLHGGIHAELSMDVLKANLTRLSDLTSYFIFFRRGEVVYACLGICCLILTLNRKFEAVTQIVVIVMMVMLLLCLTKSLDFDENSVLFSQTRMFLFIPYALLLIWYYLSLDSQPHLLGDKGKWEFMVCACAVIMVLCVSLGKMSACLSSIRDPSSSLNNPGPCNLKKVEDIVRVAKETSAYADECKADVIVTCGDDRALSYVLDAMNFGKYTVYNSVYDRRTWNYHYLMHKQPHRCVFVDLPEGNIRLRTIDIEDKSVVDYIIDEYGVYRNPYLKQ